MLTTHYHFAKSCIGLALYTPTGNMWMTRHAIMEHLRKKGYEKSVTHLMGVPGAVLALLTFAQKATILQVKTASEVMLIGGIRLLGESDPKTYEQFVPQRKPITERSISAQEGKEIRRSYIVHQEHVDEMQEMAKIIGTTRAKNAGILVPIDPSNHGFIEYNLDDGKCCGNGIRPIVEMDGFEEYMAGLMERSEQTCGLSGHEYLTISDDASLETSRFYYCGIPFGKKSKPPTEPLAENPLFA